MSFNWQTEEEREDLWLEEESQISPPKKRRLLTALILILVLAGGGWLLWRQAQQRVTEAEDRVRDQVWDSYQLGQLALENRDSELFLSLLSGRDDQWTAGEQQLFELGLVYDHQPELLGLFPITEEPVLGDITFAPDLQEATLTTTQTYTTTLLEDATRTFALEQSTVYRQGSQRWLLSPPEKEFWGEWATTRGSYLAVRYPTRDTALVDDLASDLDIMLATLCQTDLDCPQDFQVQLYLSSEPASVLLAANPETRFNVGLVVELPAPTLIGQPVDEVGYQALLQGYARYLLTAVLSTEYDCCDSVLFHQALVQYLLGRRDLIPPPLNTADYLYLLDLPLSQDYLWELWQVKEPLPPGVEAPPALLSFIQFLDERDDLPLTGEDNFWQWLAGVGGRPWEPNRSSGLTQAWIDYVHQQARLASGRLALPSNLELPAQDLLLSCGNGTYRYSFPDEQWSQILEAGVAPGRIMALPDGSGFFTVEISPEREPGTPEATLYLHYQGAVQAVSSNQGGTPLLTPFYWLNDRQFVALLSEPSLQSSSTMNLALVDLASCLAGECQYEPLAGFPVLSPDGQQLIAWNWPPDNTTLYYQPTPGAEWVEAAAGIVPFWLDEQTFGFLNRSGPGIREPQQVMVQRPGETAQRLFDADLVLAALPESFREGLLDIRWIRRHPFKENTLLVAATSRQISADERTLLLEVTLGNSSLAEEAPALSVRLLGAVDATVAGWDTMPADRLLQQGWVHFPIYHRNSYGFWVYDLRQEQQGLYSLPANPSDSFIANTYAWDSAAMWLARPLGGMVDLIALGYQSDDRPYRQLLFHDFEYCSSIDWINREMP